MKYFRFLMIGVIFGIVMTKSEAVSWFRIQEMFRFESFHMFGIIGTAVVLGAVMIALIKRAKVKSVHGEEITFAEKQSGVTILGHGVWAILIVIGSATLGTLLYGALRSKLPH